MNDGSRQWPWRTQYLPMSPAYGGMKDQLPTGHNILNLIKTSHTNRQMLTVYLESRRNKYCREYRTFYLCLKATVCKALKTLLRGQKAV